MSNLDGGPPIEPTVLDPEGIGTVTKVADQIDYGKLFDDSKVISEEEILKAAREMDARGEAVVEARDFRATHTEDQVREAVRTFNSGATRDTDEGKLDYEGFLSPYVLLEFANYMHKHREQSDGTLRDSDNWQKGIPLDEYMKSDLRHMMEAWLEHRRPTRDIDVQIDAFCGVLFNTMGYLHELLEMRDGEDRG